MRSFITALQFLTIIPLRTGTMPDKQYYRGALISFPLAGLILGITLACTNALLAGVFSETVMAVLLVVLLALLTGGLHLDGVADTFDALGSRKDKEGMLAVMRDSRIGTMGVLGLISIVLLKVSLIAAVPAALKWNALIVMPVIGRWSMLVAMYFFPYAREEGKGTVFFEAMNAKILAIATIITFALALWLTGFYGSLILAGAGLFAWAFGTLMTKKIYGITGDVLGAINEMNEVLFLLLFLVTL